MSEKQKRYTGKPRFILTSGQHKVAGLDKNGKHVEKEYVKGDVIDSDEDLVEKIKGKFAYANEQGQELTHKRGVPVTVTNPQRGSTNLGAL